MALEEDKIINAISKTGFLLEDKIRNLLVNHKWNVIANRYYIDDQKGIEREIDILAYKAFTDTKEKIMFYTALIISCKKDEENYWTFLTRPYSENDPNFEYYPLHNISTDSRLKVMLVSEREKLFTKLKEYSTLKSIINMNRRVTAFQQIKKKSYTCQNDKNIYESIITSIKATAAEKINVNKKKNDYNVCYNFNLLSVFEGEMIEYSLESNAVKETYDLHYLNRHIIDKKDDFYRIRFISSSIFERIIKEYDCLFDTNAIIYPSLISEFYHDIFNYRDRVNIYWNQFCEFTLYSINYSIRNEKISLEVTDLDFSYDKKLSILITPSHYGQFNRVLEILNDPNSSAYINTKIQLKKYFRYEDNFIFEDHLPF